MGVLLGGGLHPRPRRQRLPRARRLHARARLRGPAGPRGAGRRHRRPSSSATGPTTPTCCRSGCGSRCGTGPASSRPAWTSSSPTSPAAGWEAGGPAHRRAQDDLAGQDGRQQPLLAADQVLAVPAARPGDPRRLPRPDDEIDIQDEHVETLRPRRRARPRRHPGLHHLGPPRLPARRPLPRGAAPTCASAACTSRPCPRRPPRTPTRLLRPGRRHLAGVPRRLPGRPAAAALPLDRAHPRRHAAAAPRPHQARPLPGAELARRHPRLPARLRLLLQGGLLPRRPVVLHAGVDAALAEIERLPGRHLYFLDDNLFGSPRFAEALFDGMRGMGRAVAGGRHGAGRAAPGLLEKAVESGLRSLFVGFETLSAANLRAQRKKQNLAPATTPPPSAACTTSASWSTAPSSSAWTRTTPAVFERTVDWAVSQGIETATFHILTPYPGTRAARSAWRPRAASRATTGTSTTRATPCSGRRG